MITSDFPGNDVIDIELSSEEEEKLIDYLCKEIRAALDDRATMEKHWRDWETQANSRRKRPDAGPRDANVDMPLTREMLIAFEARMENPITQQERIYTCTPRTPAHKKISDEMEAFLDEKVDKVDFKLFLSNFINQYCTFSAGVMKTPYVVEKSPYKRWEEIDYKEYDAYKETGKETGLRTKRVVLKDDNIRYYLEVEGSYETFRGCKPIVIPVEDFIVPKCAADVDTADWVAHRVWPTKSQVEDRIREGIYREKVGDKKVIDLLGDATEKRDRIQSHEEEKEKTDERPGTQYALYETYLRWGVKKGETPYEIVCIIDIASRTILRLIANPYQQHCRPFITHTYRPILDSIYGYPMTFDLEPLHIANSASFNQRLDAASKANEVAGFFPPGSKLFKDMDRSSVRGGWHETTATKDDIWTLNVSQPFTQLPQLEEEFKQSASAIVAITAYNQGQETINRPTARGQIQIIEEGKQPLFVKLESLRKTLSKLALHILARERQFNPTGVSVWKTETNPETGEDEAVRVPVEWPERAVEEYALVEISVTSAQMSKSIRKQELTALADKLPMIYQTYMQMATTAANPQDPSALFAVKLLAGYQTVVGNMLTELDVADKGKMNPDLIQEAQVVQQIQQLMQQMQSQIQSMGTQLSTLTAQNQQLQGIGGGPGMVPPNGPPPGVQGPPPGAGMPPGPMPPQAPPQPGGQF